MHWVKPRMYCTSPRCGLFERADWIGIGDNSMKVDITVPELAESITEAVIGEWLKKPGEWIEDGEQLVDIETDKVILEVTAPQRGELASISKQTGEQVQSNEVIAVIDTSKKGRKTAAPGKEQKEKPATQKDSEPADTESKAAPDSAAPDSAAPAEEPAPSKTSPAVRKLAEEHGVDVRSIEGTGKGGRITKQDVQARIEHDREETDPAADTRVPPQGETEVTETRQDRRVPMTNLRKTIARRLVQAQQQSAMLTTFNEVNMNNIKSLRNKYKEDFEKRHGVKLGFMSFFIKASIEALKEFSIINASIEDEGIVYHDYFDIGVAVSTERGLIVPVIRDADQLRFAEIERSIADFASRARRNKISIEELSGGTFTITNGGIFGSMMSTPIINPPQSAILGMHTIMDRPVVQDGEIRVVPMMYLALSYDHRTIDGKDAVQFLVRIKETIEDPARLLLQA